MRQFGAHWMDLIVMMTRMKMLINICFLQLTVHALMTSFPMNMMICLISANFC